jgi:hypothetical protein
LFVRKDEEGKKKKKKKRRKLELVRWYGGTVFLKFFARGGVRENFKNTVLAYQRTKEKREKVKQHIKRRVVR